MAVPVVDKTVQREEDEAVVDRISRFFVVEVATSTGHGLCGDGV